MTKKRSSFKKEAKQNQWTFSTTRQRDEFKRHDETEQSKAQRANVCTIN